MTIYHAGLNLGNIFAKPFRRDTFYSGGQMVVGLVILIINFLSRLPPCKNYIFSKNSYCKKISGRRGRGEREEVCDRKHSQER